MEKNNNSDEVPLSTIVAAFLIAALAIAVFLFPVPPAEAPTTDPLPEVHIVEKAEAKEIDDVVDKELEALADAIIHCESTGRNVEIIDSNGKWSRGIAQFQDRTWAWMSEEAGVTGSPLEPEKAREVLLWALENGHAGHWTCYHIVTRS